MPNKLLHDIIYEIGKAIRDNPGKKPCVKIEHMGFSGEFAHNFISIRPFMGQKGIGVSFHLDDLPKQYKDYLTSALAMWFLDIGGRENIFDIGAEA